MAKQKAEEGVLSRALTYLAGPIDDAHDDGMGWRQYMIKGLKKRGINLIVLDPTHKLGNVAPEEVGKEKQAHLLLKKEHRWNDLSNLMKKIVRIDLREVDFIDFLIAKIDSSVHMCGTYSEIQIADLQHKPILLIIEGGKEKAPSWLFGIVDHNLMFDSEDECMEYIDAIHKGIIPLDDKWVLIRQEFKGILD